MACEESALQKDHMCMHTYPDTHTHSQADPCIRVPARVTSSRQRIHNLVLEPIILGKHHCAGPAAPFSTAQFGPTQPHWKVKR